MPSHNNIWLHRYAVLTALATLGLLCIGGLVTSHGAGMAVPDWPTSYGYGMFFLPIKFWTGGAFYEHTHRLWASTVGLLVVGLTRWLGGRKSRGPLALIGVFEIVAGLAMLWMKPELKGVGHFLAGIGGVVLLAAVVWVRNEPAPGLLPRLGWTAFWLVQFQGLLGGLRVVWFADQLGIFHATLAQLFFVLVVCLALFTSRRWMAWSAAGAEKDIPGLRLLAVTASILILGQLAIGAAMRHQHAGLAIPDFPLAYGKIWPAMDDESVSLYNQQRIEVLAARPITAFQIGLQMVHRITALVIFLVVAALAWRAHRRLAGGSPLRNLAWTWFGLILLQVGLGAATIWTNKAADVATAHVLVGALSLAVGVLWCIIAFRRFASLEAQETADLTVGSPGGTAFGSSPATITGNL